MRRLAALTAVFGLVASPARAQCLIDGVTGPAFGTYDVFSASALDTMGSVTYKCLVSLAVTIDLSTGSSGTYAARTLARIGGGSTLSYNLYADVARQSVWGDGTNGTVHYVIILALLTDVTIPIYGRIPARQGTAATGNYSDVVVITLNY